jgi:hypothetical protein
MVHRICIELHGVMVDFDLDPRFPDAHTPEILYPIHNISSKQCRLKCSFCGPETVNVTRGVFHKI